MSQRIHKLETSVVNRIAAGEIIVAPSNALKELFENSVDAGSTAIDITVKDGGLKSLQITDDGCGIVKEDLPILCERFTTSKIKNFDDLTSISSYGFRGEALASISHIAHVTVITKTKDEPTAWKAQYLDGSIVPRGSNATPLAGKVGTQITVDDIFFNVPSRKRAFKSASEEYAKILNVVGRYLIHCKGISISCKKYGDPHPTLSVRKEAGVVDRIRNVFGSNVANELLEVEFDGTDDDESSKIGLERICGQVSNANYSSKKSISPVLFVNNRLVTCDGLRRALGQVYASFLPRGGHYFAYLALQIDARNVDINVHPTKREVHFLFEDEIIELVCSEVQKVLADVDTSRSFATQTIIAGVSSQVSSSQAKRPYEYNLVRTDSKQPKISTLFSQKHYSLERSSSNGSGQSPAAGGKKFTPSNLRSIKKLKDEVEKNAHKGLTDIFSKHTFVGIVDYTKRLAAIQYDVKLFLVDYGAVAKELFYQIALADFGNYGTIELDGEVSVRKLLEAVVDAKRQEGDEEGDELDEGFVDNTIRLLDENAEMMKEYFNIVLERKESNESDNYDLFIKTIPLLLKNYMPPLNKLPGFLYQLGKSVNWEIEIDCFHTFLTQLALFYTPEPLYEQKEGETQTDVRENVEIILFPTIQRRLIACKTLVNHTIEIANLPGLYKVFERC